MKASTVTPAHSDKEGAEPNFKGYGHHPLLSYCDNTDESLAGMLRAGSAGSDTAADHITVLEEAIAALPPAHQRRLMVTADGAGASHDLVTRLDKLAARPGYQVIYSVGWELGKREKVAITRSRGATRLCVAGCVRCGEAAKQGADQPDDAIFGKVGLLPTLRVGDQQGRVVARGCGWVDPAEARVGKRQRAALQDVEQANAEPLRLPEPTAGA